MDPDVITETDIEGGEPISAAQLDDLYNDWYEERRYWDEVRSCCNGRSWDCQHFRYYPELDDRFTYREDW